MAYAQVRREYAHWLALPKRTKIAFGLPTTNEDFASDKGMSSRTLRKWKSEPEFVELVEQLKVQMAKESPNSTVATEMVGGPRPVTYASSKDRVAPPRPATPADDVGASVEETEWNRIRSTLAASAADGNQGAMDLYMKYWGKAFIEAERAADEGLFTELSDEELVAELCRMVGVERLAEFLADEVTA